MCFIPIFHSKRVDGYIHARLPGGSGAESPDFMITDGMECETECINRLDREEERTELNGME